MKSALLAACLAAFASCATSRPFVGPPEKPASDLEMKAFLRRLEKDCPPSKPCDLTIQVDRVEIEPEADPYVSAFFQGFFRAALGNP